MAKSKRKSKGMMAAMPSDNDGDEWQTRDDVNTLMRADEVHADSKRHKRAVSRLSGTLSRITGKNAGRSQGRSR
jgi:hypothetical protein